MKAALIMALATIVAANAYSQTNTFPSTGSAGVGTTSPLSRLHLEGNSGTTAKFLVRGTAGINPSIELASTESGPGLEQTEGLLIKYDNSIGESLFNNIYTLSTNAFRFMSGGTDRLTLQTDGDVGIGTTTPLTKLHLEGPTAASAKLLVRGGNYSTNPSIELGSAENGVNTETYEGLVIKYINEVGESVFNNLFTPAPNAFRFQSGGTDRLIIKSNGNIGIGSSNPDKKLTVKGSVHAEEVQVDVTVPGPDFVFDESYNLMPITEVEKYIRANRHLPLVPSASQMEENGIELGKMNLKLLQKVEELTLYMIEQNKEMGVLREKLAEMSKKVEEMAVLQKGSK